MSSGLAIPGVTDKYKTNDLVEALMATERIPLEREQATLETYQNQQAAWRDVNQRMSTLRTSVKPELEARVVKVSAKRGTCRPAAGKDSEPVRFKGIL